jgi:hypothetical protein
MAENQPCARPPVLSNHACMQVALCILNYYWTFNLLYSVRARGSRASSSRQDAADAAASSKLL